MVDQERRYYHPHPVVHDPGAPEFAAPYFRVFNPILQGEKFDPDGVYVRRWVPWRTSRRVSSTGPGARHRSKSAGVELGRSYPEPIVDHRITRERALAA